MEAIYPVTALQKQQGEVREAARSGLVRITENGRGAYVFCSEDVFEELLARERADAADEARMRAVCERAYADIEAGRVYETALDARAAVEEKAAALHG
jgi:PHD/YefM family antitoxin component YafN of YafNO toxin-antitoxin module